MVQRREQPRFAIETRAALGIEGEALRERLDRDRACEPQIARAVDLAPGL